MNQRIQYPVILFASAVFSGAFLLFLIQPMLGKLILPWFGGGPGVWTACLMFYQAALFLGYLYAYGLVRFFEPRTQWLVHAIAFSGALFLLPVTPGEQWRPEGFGADPSIAIAIMLIATVGLPFMVLSATGPLLQAWFAARYSDRSPYPLYAVSNLGSLAALFSFPLLVEPFFPMREAGWLWSLGFGVAMILILAAGLMAVVRVPAGLRVEAGQGERTLKQPSVGQYFQWMLLAACAVIVLMAITNKLCLDVASFPFLWILPLALYLGSYILCFASERFYSRRLWLSVLLAALALKYLVVLWVPQSGVVSIFFWSIFVQIPLFATILFSFCMLIHGELYRLRPSAASLTSFYLALSGGGALGGLFVGLIAPRIFDDYVELQLAYGVAWGLVAYLFARDPESWMSLARARWRVGGVAAVSVLVLSVTVAGMRVDPEGLVHEERNFFGVLRVMDWEIDSPENSRRILKHGTTIHGAQLLSAGYRQRPISYYGVATGIGLALAQRSSGERLDIGIIGMGAGSLAAYGRGGDRIRFYEIDPAVVRLASWGGYFTFLADSRASVEVIPGDGRLSLQQELDEGRRNRFDFLIIDAFSSDAVPFHLLTREAYGLFLEHLKPSGLIAAHVSNRHFELASILYRIGESYGLEVLSVNNPGFGLKIAGPARWIFMSRDPTKIQALQTSGVERMKKLRLDGSKVDFGVLSPSDYMGEPLWTDDFNSLLGVLNSAK